MKQNRTLTVTQLNEYIKMLFDSQSVLKRLYVRGEISNFKSYSSGHCYFTLKDENSLVRAVIFRSYVQKLKFRPEDGMKVIVCGSVSVYERDGQYQLYAEDMEPDGVGALYVAFEQLKRKLESEGLFAQERKRPIPQFPSRIGIVTSPSGAAVRDMINITGRRYPSAELILYPSAVQGSEAPKQLIAGIEYFSKNKNVDLVIIGRGGGSLEDLWAFNNEQLARAIAVSSVPVISAVGHETDFTICDFVADCRAPTPSAAAEIAVPNTPELIASLNSIKGRMGTLLSRRITENREKIRLLSSSRSMVDPMRLLNDRQIRLDRLSDRFESTAKVQIAKHQSDIREAAAKLASLNPLAILSRGYGAITNDSGGIVTKSCELNVGQPIKIRFADGTVRAEVKDKE